MVRARGMVWFREEVKGTGRRASRREPKSLAEPRFSMGVAFKC